MLISTEICASCGGGGGGGASLSDGQSSILQPGHLSFRRPHRKPQTESRSQDPAGEQDVNRCSRCPAGLIAAVTRHRPDVTHCCRGGKENQPTNVRQALIMGCGTSVATETQEKRAKTGSYENAPLILSRVTQVLVGPPAAGLRLTHLPPSERSFQGGRAGADRLKVVIRLTAELG